MPRNRPQRPRVLASVRTRARARLFQPPPASSPFRPWQAPGPRDTLRAPAARQPPGRMLMRGGAGRGEAGGGALPRAGARGGGLGDCEVAADARSGVLKRRGRRRPRQRRCRSRFREVAVASVRGGGAQVCVPRLSHSVPFPLTPPHSFHHGRAATAPGSS